MFIWKRIAWSVYQWRRTKLTINRPGVACAWFNQLTGVGFVTAHNVPRHGSWLFRKWFIIYTQGLAQYVEGEEDNETKNEIKRRNWRAMDTYTTHELDSQGPRRLIFSSGSEFTSLFAYFLLFLITSIGFCMRNHVGSCSKQYLAVKFPVFIPLSFENNPCKVVAGT